MGGSLKQNPKNLLVGGFVLFFKQRVTLWRSGKLQSARIHNEHCKPPKYRGCTRDVTAATPSALIQHWSCSLISAPGEVRPPNTRLWNVLRYRTKTIVLQGVEGQKSAHCLPGGGCIHESPESSFLFLACSLAALGLGSVGQRTERARLRDSSAGRGTRAGETPQPSQPASWEGNPAQGLPARSGCWHPFCSNGDAAPRRGPWAPHSRRKGWMCPAVVPGCLLTPYGLWVCWSPLTVSTVSAAQITPQKPSPW